MNGLGVYDFIIKYQYDPETGETYDPLVSCNDAVMAERCKIKSAHKCVWTIKASADFNSNSATLLRAAIKNGNINLLINEMDAEDYVKKISGYKSMNDREQALLLVPYVQTSLLINEMINLEHEVQNNKIKLKEHTGMRKDRFSSMLYNYYITQSLSNDLKPKQDIVEELSAFTIRPAKIPGLF